MADCRRFRLEQCATERRATRLSHVRSTTTKSGRMIADADIQRAATELVERYGDNAMVVAHERVASLSTAQDWSGINIALRVLSSVEVLLAGGRP